MIPLGGQAPHVGPTVQTCGEANEIELTIRGPMDYSTALVQAAATLTAYFTALVQVAATHGLPGSLTLNTADDIRRLNTTFVRGAPGS